MSKAARKFIDELSVEKDFVKRFSILSEFLNLYYDSDFEQVNAVLERELEFYIENKHLDGEVLVRFMLSYSSFESGNVKRGNEEMDKVVKMFDKVKDHSARAQILNFFAFYHSHRGDFEKAFQCAYDCIREGEWSGDNKNKFWGTYTLGVLHFDLKDYTNSEKSYLLAVEGFRKYNNQYGIARSETGLSSICIHYGKYEEAEIYLQRSLAYYREMEVTTGQSRSLNDLGVIARKTMQFQKALDYLKEALQLRKSTNHLQGIATSLNEIAELLLEMKAYAEAETHLQEAIAACGKVNNRAKLFRAYYLFSSLYKNTGRFDKALEYYELHDKLKSEVTGETANNKIKELQTRMATEKSQKEAEIHRLKNVELKKAYDEIELKNKEILDSINYAKRLQEAILPPDKLVKTYFPESFVLYKPKDIVAGDFYWMESSADFIFIAAADCTGHGVPGAMVSVVCSNALNRTVKEFKILDPGKILDKVRELVLETFEKGEGDVQDGMDISLVAINRKTKEIKWAGANNPLWYTDSTGLKELKADKQPVGKYFDPKPFTSHGLTLLPNSVLYLFTDGFADQFGGPKGKKFKYKQLEELISLHHEKLPEEQCAILEQKFMDWKGDFEQIDDVCIIGIKI